MAQRWAVSQVGSCSDRARSARGGIPRDARRYICERECVCTRAPGPNAARDCAVPREQPAVAPRGTVDFHAAFYTLQTWNESTLFGLGMMRGNPSLPLDLGTDFTGFVAADTTSTSGGSRPITVMEAVKTGLIFIVLTDVVLVSANNCT